MASFEAKAAVDQMVEVIRSNGTNFANFIDQAEVLVAGDPVVRKDGKLFYVFRVPYPYARCRA